MYIDSINSTNLIILFSLFICISILVVLSIISVMRYIKEKQIAFVKAHSIKLAKIIELKTNLRLFHLKTEFEETKAHNSKRSFDNLSMDDYLHLYVYDNLELFEKIIPLVKENRKRYNKFLSDVKAMPQEIPLDSINSSKMTCEKFLSYENKLVEKELHSFETFTDIEINLFSKYVSPTGRNQYYDKINCDFNRLTVVAKEVKDEISKQQIIDAKKRAERAKMSDKLRYEILKRDGFRCQICGATQADGVKLHVDHIYPVSKGGKTEESNLRTLCERCNMGKGDSIE